jgi:hypothetical protein
MCPIIIITIIIILGQVPKIPAMSDFLSLPYLIQQDLHFHPFFCK